MIVNFLTRQEWFDIIGAVYIRHSFVITQRLIKQSTTESSMCKTDTWEESKGKAAAIVRHLRVLVDSIGLFRSFVSSNRRGVTPSPRFFWE